jgi:hypothetical protein
LILVRLPELQSVVDDAYGESGLWRVTHRNDDGVSYFFLVFLLYEFYNLRMSQVAGGTYFTIYILIYNYRVLLIFKLSTTSMHC